MRYATLRSISAATGDQVPKNPKGREHRPLPEKITDLSADVLDGTIRLPKFQRDFVWTRQQMLDLLDSIARGYPQRLLARGSPQRTSRSCRSWTPRRSDQ